ncbi:1-acyl-sn-glycerol-3-phosphate acyltransferase [Streptomyces albidoflavus]
MSTAAPEEAPRTTRPLPRAGALLRRLLWWCVLTLTGGVERRGALPPGGCVVVANHTSHADTAALLATLDARHAPLIGAAADYWFASPWRRRICGRLAAGFPVRRTGGGLGDLLERTAELRAGRAVVLFPEGTRGADDGRLGTFHRGALLLAREAGVPVVPVGIAGTGRLLPKHGRLRPALVRVRVGAPLGPSAEPEEARAAVAALHARTVAEPLRDSAVRRRVAALVARRGLLLAFVWACAEALSWPLMPELLLGVVCTAVPRSALRVSLAALAGSVAGGLLALHLAAAGAELPAPLTTERMRSEARVALERDGARAVHAQPWNGVPFKVYAAEAGRAGTDTGAWLLHSTEARGTRTLGVGAAFGLLGFLLHRLRRLYGVYLVLLGGGFAVGLGLIVRGWA